MKIRTKTVLGIAIIEAVLAAVLLGMMLSYISDTNYKAVEKRATSTATLFASSVKDAVLAFDLATIESVANEVVGQEDMIYARVLDSQGRVMAEAGQYSTADYSERASEARDAIYDDHAYILLDGRVFGEVQIGLSAAQIPLLVADARNWGLTVASIEMLLVAIFSLMLGVFLTRKLQRLGLAASRIAKGDLTTPIVIDGNDEVDALASSLESMRAEIRQSQESLTQYNGQLESTVAKRTEELQRSKTEMESSRQREAHVFSIVGHEMRTPLAATQMMLQNTEMPLDRQLLLETVEHTLDLVDDMSLISGAQRQIDSTEKVEFCAQIQSTLASITPLLESEGFTLHQNLQQCQQMLVKFPARYLRQILLNLVKNAVRHSEGQNIWVELEGEMLNDGLADIRIIVRDDGVGIAKADRERIFGAFQRGLSKSEGTGIGLSVIREILLSFGGSVECTDPENGQGSQFVVSLQLAVEELVADQDLTALELYCLEGKTVLVAEDNLVIQMLTREMLTKLGAQVRVAADGRKALEAFGPEIDVVLTDIMMPHMNGYELTAALREQGYRGPIIGVTAATVGAERDQLLAAGVDAALPKPITVEKLTNALAQWQARQLSS